MNKLILLDMDILVYSIGYSVESSIYVCDGQMYKRKGFAEKICKEKGLDPETSIHKRKSYGTFGQATMNLKTKMASIFDDLGTKNYRGFITAGDVEPNFRDKLATLQKYKDNRSGSERPLHYHRLRDFLVNNYGAEVIQGQEADDKIGIEQYRIAKEKGHFDSTYIATIDKDLRCLEGNHYHLNRGTIDYVNADEALKNFYGQLLTGDSTDNIPGICKLLKNDDRLKEANKLSYSDHYLAKWNEYRVDHTPEECYNYVIEYYFRHGYGMKEIDEIGNLLWIRRNENEIWSEIR